MRRRRYSYVSALAAIGLTAGLTCAPAADATVQAADPVTMTNGFYVNPGNSAAVWSAANPNDGREPAIESAIANEPSAVWFTGSESSIGASTWTYTNAAEQAGQLPVLVAYNIPDRDICAGQSAGGASSDGAYDTWIGGFAGGIGDHPAVVILEPDALADESCMNAPEIPDRDGLLNFAITQFNDQAPNTYVYLDAGNPGWLPAATMASYLNSAGLASAHGFSLNVSSFYTVAQNVAYGNAGMKLGPTDQVGGGAEMLLWIKDPGESDGDCGTGDGTIAGQFDPQIAYDLVYGY